MKPISVERLREEVAAGRLTDPLIFLEGLVRGDDLRKRSMVYELVKEIGFHATPDADDWLELVALVRRHCKYEGVSITESQRAAVTMAEYLHPKVKSDDGSVEAGGGAALVPLDPEEVKLFKEKWNEDY